MLYSSQGHPYSSVFMQIFDAILLGIIEGITEFLPISSTGHLMAVAHARGLAGDAFASTFEIAIQLGAMLAVIAIYPKRLLADRAVILRVAAAFLPTALLGALVYPLVKDVLLSDVRIVAYALIVGGIAIIAFERLKIARTASMEIAALPLPRAAWIGVFQAIAFIPGVSRAAATMMSGMWLGLSRKEAIEFSFFLAVPTMAAATALDIMKTDAVLGGRGWILLLVGSVVAFAVALAAIKLLIRFVEAWTLEPFGYYRIAAGLALLALLA